MYSRVVWRTTPKVEYEGRTCTNNKMAAAKYLVPLTKIPSMPVRLPHKRKNCLAEELVPRQFFPNVWPFEILVGTIWRGVYTPTSYPTYTRNRQKQRAGKTEVNNNRYNLNANLLIHLHYTRLFVACQVADRWNHSGDKRIGKSQVNVCSYEYIVRHLCSPVYIYNLLYG